MKSDQRGDSRLDIDARPIAETLPGARKVERTEQSVAGRLGRIDADAEERQMACDDAGDRFFRQVLAARDVDRNAAAGRCRDRGQHRGDDVVDMDELALDASGKVDYQATSTLRR